MADSSTSGARVLAKNEIHVRFDLSAPEMQKLSSDLMAEVKAAEDAVAALPEGAHSFENTVLALAFNEGHADTLSSSVTFPQYVATDSERRDASSAATKELSAFQIECNTREDVYRSLKAFEAKGEKLNDLDARLLQKTLLTYERNGLALDPEKRDALKKIRKEISDLCIEFQKNLNEDTTSLTFTEEELVGLPSSFISALEKNDEGKYIVTLKYPHLFPVLNWGANPDTRRRMEEANALKVNKENVPLLERVLVLRREAAHLLGYKNHASFILEERMAKTHETVIQFLAELRQKLIPAATKELAVLRDLKRKKEGSLEGYKDEILGHDFRFYHTLNKQENYSVNEDAIKDYFPMHLVTKGMLEVYEELLSLKFRKVPDEEGVPKWHEDVDLFEVKEAASDKVIGFFFLDLYPRDGKYGHAAVFPIQPRYERVDGSVQLPVAAMVANFTKPTPDQPSLLKFDEVETFFHEFGHVMHNMCTDAKYARFSGTAVERDFVEAPSQMLENWCYESDVLQRLSGHYEREEEVLPQSLLEPIVAAKNADTGLLNLRQIFFGTFDTTVHSCEDDEIATEPLWQRLRPEVTLIPQAPNTNPAAGFGHIMGGYDAQYYGYLWSEVFSADMFARFKAEGVLSPELGSLYRECILAPGGSAESMVGLKKFLGREPTQEAFLKHIGLE
eukprot:TRINITY_DN3179_c0_g1_i2.p1 TRINITY_DN3179_c0_g1~~TRINITY_DN3179_c0_g1_i2.p1  ORF type:complete len:788 (-),score=269.81 TRINITY_DN3179_c0_g1_i2:248-2275(-)